MSSLSLHVVLCKDHTAGFNVVVQFSLWTFLLQWIALWHPIYIISLGIFFKMMIWKQKKNFEWCEKHINTKLHPDLLHFWWKQKYWNLKMWTDEIKTIYAHTVDANSSCSSCPGLRHLWHLLPIFHQWLTPFFAPHIFDCDVQKPVEVLLFCARVLAVKPCVFSQPSQNPVVTEGEHCCSAKWMGDRRRGHAGEQRSRNLSLDELYAPAGSRPVFHTVSGYWAGILMAGFVFISLCLDSWALGIRDVKALAAVLLSSTSVSLCESFGQVCVKPR